MNPKPRFTMLVAMAAAIFLLGAAGTSWAVTDEEYQAVLQENRLLQLKNKEMEKLVQERAAMAAMLQERVAGLQANLAQVQAATADQVKRLAADRDAAVAVARQAQDALREAVDRAAAERDKALKQLAKGGAETKEAAKAPDAKAIQTRMQKWVDLHPTGSRFVWAAIHLHTGQAKEAVLLLKTNLGFDPDDDATRLALARAHQALGENDKAVALLQELVKRQPASPEALYALAMVHIRAGGLEKGRQLLKQALEIDPLFAPGNLQLADLELSVGRPAEARNLAARVLCLEEPGSPLALKALEILDKILTQEEAARKE